jgi:DNA-directed RNA polymerase specialized sigma24 family protein
LDSTDAPGGSSSFQQELLALRFDPQVIGLARRWAGNDRQLAKDGLDVAHYKVATVPHPERIDNLKAYFLTVLRNEINALHVQHRKTTPHQNPAAALELGQHGTVVCGPARSRSMDDLVRTRLLAGSLRTRLTAQRLNLLLAIPARSDDPRRYKTVIFHAAEQVMLDGLNGDASDADSNDAFCEAYPEYFKQPGVAVNTCHQRFRRAREDVKALLHTIVDRDELT